MGPSTAPSRAELAGGGGRLLLRGLGAAEGGDAALAALRGGAAASGAAAGPAPSQLILVGVLEPDRPLPLRWLGGPLRWLAPPRLLLRGGVARKVAALPLRLVSVLRERAEATPSVPACPRSARPITSSATRPRMYRPSARSSVTVTTVPGASWPICSLSRR